MMASELEVRERHKTMLMVLLELKRDNAERAVVGLKAAIDRAIVAMDAEDIAWVEKVVGVKAL